MAPYMPTIFPFHSRLFINKTILFRRLSPIITRVFYFLEYFGDSEKTRLFCRSFNQTGIIKRQIVWPILVPRISCLSNAFDERLEDTLRHSTFLTNINTWSIPQEVKLVRSTRPRSTFSYKHRKKTIRLKLDRNETVR